MEIFVFLKMGGSKDTIWLADIGDDSVKNTLVSFDASKAKCFLAKDKERLFAVIESGFGDFLHFNASVQGIFTTGNDAQIASQPGAKKAKKRAIQYAYENASPSAEKVHPIG